MYPCLAPCHLVNGLKKCSRLLELRTLKFYDPDENNTLKSSMISVLLLDTIINMCTDMRCTFTSCWARQMVREELGVCRDSPLSEAEMQNVLRDLGEFDKFAKATKGIMKRRQQNVLTRSKAKQLDSLVYKKLMKQLAADVQRACAKYVVSCCVLCNGETCLCELAHCQAAKAAWRRTSTRSQCAHTMMTFFDV